MGAVRIAIVGMGSAGLLHAQALTAGQVPDATLTAVVCREARFQDAAAQLPAGTRHFETLDDLLAAPNTCDAVIIATPHPLHPEQTIAALEAGLHVFCEKPAGVRASEARAMMSSAEWNGRFYSLNFNRRTVPLYQEMRTLIAQGKIGELRRIHWTSTSWLRGQSYYDDSPWRGTWAGEGGGMLLNQWPHVLDLWQWICGMPTRLRAYCGFGKHHAIEVEDEVSVFAEYANGATATLVGATGEAPGMERIEIVGDRGRMIVEDKQIHLTLLKDGTVGDFITGAPGGFSWPAELNEVFKPEGDGDLVAGITRDFVAAIVAGEKGELLAPGQSGLDGLTLANAILLSGWQDGAWVPLPMSADDEALFERSLAQHAANSKTRDVTLASAFALKDSFKHV
jgi:predicted dehydrogenase